MVEDVHQEPKREAETREHLANERTLLAWVRTGIAVISIGIVIERAGLFLGRGGFNEVLGMALAMLGCITLILGAYQFRRTRQQILRGQFTSASAIYLAVVVGGLLIGGLFIIHVLVFS